MKQVLLSLFLAIFSIGISIGQDLLYATDGEIIQVKIMKITDTHIKFEKKALPGVAFSYERDKVLKVVYENGSEEIITKRKDPINRPQDITKPDHVKGIKEINEEKLAEKRHAFYGGIMGAGGLFSTNYELNVVRGKWAHPYFRVGFGISNKSIFVPHSFTVGIGNLHHQFDLGIGGALFITMLEPTDDYKEETLSFVYGKAENKYLFYPVFGYRFVTVKGFYAKIAMTPIIAKDDYNPLGGSTKEEWGITPWGEIGFGFTF